MVILSKKLYALEYLQFFFSYPRMVFMNCPPNSCPLMFVISVKISRYLRYATIAKYQFNLRSQR